MLTVWVTVNGLVTSVSCVSVLLCMCHRHRNIECCEHPPRFVDLNGAIPQHNDCSVQGGLLMLFQRTMFTNSYVRKS